MEYNVRGENIEVTPALREHVEKKIGKLERYFENNVDAIVHVNLKFYNDQESKVEVTIPMTDLSLRAEVHHEDMYNAIDLATNKLERQIRKHKTKVNRKFREKVLRSMFLPKKTASERPCRMTLRMNSRRLSVKSALI